MDINGDDMNGYEGGRMKRRRSPFGGGKQGRNDKLAKTKFSNRKTGGAGQPRYWTKEEHSRFLEATLIFGEKDVRAIAAHVATRNPVQVRTHAQKYKIRLGRQLEDLVGSPELVASEGLALLTSHSVPPSPLMLSMDAQIDGSSEYAKRRARAMSYPEGETLYIADTTTTATTIRAVTPPKESEGPRSPEIGGLPPLHPTTGPSPIIHPEPLTNPPLRIKLPSRFKEPKIDSADSVHSGAMDLVRLMSNVAESPSKFRKRFYSEPATAPPRQRRRKGRTTANRNIMKSESPLNPPPISISIQKTDEDEEIDVLGDSERDANDMPPPEPRVKQNFHDTRSEVNPPRTYSPPV